MSTAEVKQKNEDDDSRPSVSPSRQSPLNLHERRLLRPFFLLQVTSSVLGLLLKKQQTQE